MQKVISRRKVYVKVVVEHEIDGSCFPRFITFADGRTYFIDKVIDTVDMHLLDKNANGIRYTVDIGGQSAFLTDERNGRWSVKEKVYAN